MTQCLGEGRWFGTRDGRGEAAGKRWQQTLVLRADGSQIADDGGGAVGLRSTGVTLQQERRTEASAGERTLARTGCPHDKQEAIPWILRACQDDFLATANGGVASEENFGMLGLIGFETAERTPVFAPKPRRSRFDLTEFFEHIGGGAGTLLLVEGEQVIDKIEQTLRVARGAC